MTTNTTAPTAAAEAMAHQLAQLLTAIAERFRTLGLEAGAAVERGDFGPTDQLVADEDAIVDAVQLVVDRFTATDERSDQVIASDSASNFLGTLTGVLQLWCVAEDARAA